MARVFMIHAMLVVIAVVAGEVAAQSDVTDIGTRKQLFVDGALIGSSDGVTLTVNRPVRDPEPVMDAGPLPRDKYMPILDHDLRGAELPPEDDPTGFELIWALYNQVLYDEGVYKMWYQARRGGSLRVSYAESADGVNWVRPRLGLVEIAGSTDNNVVFPTTGTDDDFGVELGCVFIDTNPACRPEERYKMVVRWRRHGDNGHRTWVCSSPDGIHFTPIADKPSFRDSDTGNICFWDDRIGRYVAYVRKWLPGRQAPRVVCRCEFDDLRDWGEETVVFQTDERDPVEVDVYTNAAVKYEGVYFMFPSMLHNHPRGKELWEEGVNHQWMDIQFAASRDGEQWERYDRRPFLSLETPERWDSAMLYMFTGLVVHDTEIWMYYWGRNYPHAGVNVPEDRPMRSAFGRLRLRLDGFVSADAAYDGGTLTTVPVRFAGETLVLNVDNSVSGWTRVGLLDGDGRPIPGYTVEDADIIIGNDTSVKASWKGDSDVSSLAGAPVRLHFVMRDAKLYSFRFVEPED